ncbi:MAG: hypothetical protein IPI67_16860 [Myxococcales bacterium]|nr:hypothetical protein [Myxococcales bacterium]
MTVESTPTGRESRVSWRSLLARVPQLPAALLRLFMLARPLPLFFAVAWLLRPSVPLAAARAEADRKKAVALALEERGLHAVAEEVFFLDPEPGTLASIRTTVRALVRARAGEDPSDIWLLTSRWSPEGRLLEITGSYDLSDTSAVDEQSLVVDGLRAAWVIGSDGKAFTLKLADLSGEPRPSGWSTLARWQSRITNLQETGQQTGVGQRSFRLDPPAEHTRLHFDGDGLSADADGRKIRIPTSGDGPIEGGHYLLEQTPEKSRPGNLVTWAVDRVRALSWFGSDRMQLVKAVAFEGLDAFQRVVGKLTGDTGAERVKEELAGLEDAPLAPELPDPETGWPPAPMEPMISPALDGEGKWRPLDKDPFIPRNAGAPAPFVQSFIRTDQKRAYNQTWVLVWDPRQIALHSMSGTVEPKSATGETGPGLVPRKPEVMSRLVGGFNGGFQATHGEFGMMADGVVYLPPKPYSATVAELTDGSTAFGTWPNDEKVPDNIVSFRQNMTPLVVDGTVNPYKRNWWGGVPPGWTDESRTTRSAVCETKEGFVAYLYGASIDADHLALAMQRARCVYGIHLDMNPGHTGFEFYRAAPAAALPAVGRKLDPQWEAEGTVSGMDGWRFLSRRMLRYMGLMNFPRYIQRESRDFFYLTLRNLVPGDALPARVTPAEPGEGEWKVKGLPQHGWPYALATTWLRAEPARADTKITLLKVDAAAVRLAARDDKEPKVVVSFPAPPALGPALWLGSRGFAIGPTSPDPSGVALARGASSPETTSLAALGVDRAGMLLYAEVSTARDAARDGKLLETLLHDLGVETKLYLSKPLALSLGGDRDLGGRALEPSPGALALVRRLTPGVTRIFPDTPVVPVNVWYPLQAKRVRYFPKPKKEAPEAGGAEPTE